MKNKNILIIAPHADDETLGCGGYLLKAIAAGAQVTWAIVTSMTKEGGYTEEQIKNRAKLIERVSAAYGFAHTIQMGFAAGRVDKVETSQLVGEIKKAIAVAKADTLMIPYEHDIHSDHRVIAHAAVSASKWFREPSVTQILMYETPSETDLNILPSALNFKPNLFANISSCMAKKMEILQLYQEELGEFPFPRSKTYCEALAHIRGGQSGFKAAESFMMIKELQP